MLTTQEKAERDIQQDIEEGIAVGRVIRELTKEEQEENQKEIYSIIDKICSEFYREDFEVRFNKDNKEISFFSISKKYSDFSIKFFIDKEYPKTIMWGNFEIKCCTNSEGLETISQDKKFKQVMEFMKKVESEISVEDF